MDDQCFSVQWSYGTPSRAWWACQARIVFGCPPPQGCTALLAAQLPNGWWKSSDYLHHLSAWDTCFAILFLKRATRQMVASKDRTGLR